MIIESNILMSFLQKCDTIFMGDYMEEKLAILLEKINLDSETKELFFNSKLSHITKKKDNSKNDSEMKSKTKNKKIKKKKEIKQTKVDA